MIELPDIVAASTASTVVAYQEDNVASQPLALTEEGIPDTLNGL